MQTFIKNERLCSKLIIDKLVNKGNSFYNSPFKIIWHEIPQSIMPVQILISVPKRKFKKAVDRNSIKRLIREVYRKHKALLYTNLNTKKINLMLIYTSTTIINHSELEEKLIETLKRLNKKITEQS
ncbi:MAG: ribonuclease P protein component [Bacteroidia bacterium]